MIQSYQNCPVLIMTAVFRTATSLYVTGSVIPKNECQNFPNVHSTRTNWKCKYYYMRFRDNVSAIVFPFDEM